LGWSFSLAHFLFMALVSAIPYVESAGLEPRPVNPLVAEVM